MGRRVAGGACQKSPRSRAAAPAAPTASASARRNAVLLERADGQAQAVGSSGGRARRP
jgi:hypothetical protein